MKTIVSSRQEAVRAAAEQVLELIRKKPDAVLAIGAGEDELGILDAVASRAAETQLSLASLRLLAVCEFDGPAREREQSARARLIRHLIDKTDAQEEKLFVPDADAPERYDALIRELGGLDLAVLGLGENARVGFNEPATQFDTHTHVQKLTDRTRRELAALFGGEEAVPQRGVTMGFQELCSAREILVIALGESKSKALFHMLYGRDDSVYPAAFLQLPLNVTVYADVSAASELEGKSFDAVAFNGN